MMRLSHDVLCTPEACVCSAVRLADACMLHGLKEIALMSQVCPHGWTRCWCLLLPVCLSAAGACCCSCCWRLLLLLLLALAAGACCCSCCCCLCCCCLLLLLLLLLPAAAAATLKLVEPHLCDSHVWCGRHSVAAAIAESRHVGGVLARRDGGDAFKRVVHGCYLFKYLSLKGTGDPQWMGADNHAVAAAVEQLQCQDKCMLALATLDTPTDLLFWWDLAVIVAVPCALAEGNTRICPCCLCHDRFHEPCRLSKVTHKLKHRLLGWLDGFSANTPSPDRASSVSNEYKLSSAREFTSNRLKS
mgnify:CR=1 FL=1